jgi:hypothetical protein
VTNSWTVEYRQNFNLYVRKNVRFHCRSGLTHLLVAKIHFSSKLGSCSNRRYVQTVNVLPTVNRCFAVDCWHYIRSRALTSVRIASPLLTSTWFEVVEIFSRTPLWQQCRTFDFRYHFDILSALPSQLAINTFFSIRFRTSNAQSRSLFAKI